MGLLSANMLAELQRGTRSVVPVLEISNVGPTAKTIRLASVRGGVASASLGAYKTRIVDMGWGHWTRSAADRRNALTTFNGTVTIDDADLGFLPDIYQLYRCASTVKLVSPNLTNTSDYFTFHVGKVASIQQDGTRWSISIRPNDSAMDAPFPKGKITVIDWSSAHQRAIGQPLPILYGSHSAQNLIFPVGGQVPLLYVDTSNWKFVVAGHVCKSVPRVYIGATLKTVVTHYNLSYPIVGGRQYTVVTFTSDPGADPVVTADVDGIETVGDGSGTLISNPADMLKHLLVNWIFGDYRKGAWLLDATAPVDTTLFSAASTFISSFLGVTAFARRIGEQQRTGTDELNQWCSDLEIPAFWTNAGKIGISVFDHTLQDSGAYPAGRLRESVDVVGGQIGLEFLDQAYTPRILTSYAPRIDDNYSERWLFAIESQDATSIVGTQEPKEARWFPVGTGYFIPRLADAWRINRYRSLLPNLTATVRGSFLDYELMTQLGVTWARGPNENGTAGWGDKKWQRVPVCVIEQDADLDAMTVGLRAQDLRATLSSFWHVWKNTKRVSSSEEGTIKLNIGQFEVTTRASKKYSDDPSGSVVELANDVIPSDTTGLLVEDASTNELIRSSFINGTTGITITGASGTVAADTADTLIETPTGASPAGGNSLKFTAGTPHTADLTARPTSDTASIVANTKVRVSIDHKDDSGASFIWRLQRLFDNNWWRESDSTWQVATTDNALPVSTTTVRPTSKLIDVGANNTALRLFSVQLSGGTSARVNRAYHWQLEQKRWATSRIISDGSAGTRAADTVKVTNDTSGKTIWPVAHGTWELTFRPLYDAADLAAGSLFYLLSLEYDASNKWELFYDKDAAALKFVIRAAGVNYTASGAYVPARGVEQKVAIRWTSASDGELSLTALTADIFVGTTKGTGVVYVTPTTAASKNLYLGCKTGTPATNQLNGSIISARVSPLCKPDGAINVAYPI